MAFPRPMPPRAAAPILPPQKTSLPPQMMLYYNRTQPGFRPENEVNDLVQQYKQIAGRGKAFASKTKAPQA